MTIIACGDIHGCLDELRQLIEVNLNEFQGRDDVTWVFLGDYVDRGPNVKGVIDYLQEFEKTHNTVFLKGSHEDMALMSRFRGESPHWSRNGGRETMDSYEERIVSDDHERWMKRTHLKFQHGDYFFCHAGVYPGIPFDEQSENDLLWIRRDFLYSDEDFGKIVVHGHSVESLDRPVVRNNRINLDTGCVFGGHLTAGIFEDNMEPIFEQVKSNYSWEKAHLKIRNL